MDNDPTDLQDAIDRKLAQARGICKVIQHADFREVFPSDALQLTMWGVHDLLNDVSELIERRAKLPAEAAHG